MPAVDVVVELGTTDDPAGWFASALLVRRATASFVESVITIRVSPGIATRRLLQDPLMRVTN
jgi:hypothetical protein